MKAQARRDLLALLQDRFQSHPERHEGCSWAEVEARLDASLSALATLQRMEDTGGEPDVIGRRDGGFVFCDCAAESPAGRRSLCYDAKALDARKENRPQDSATAMASAIGIALLTEAEYEGLQSLGDFDLKTSSWVRTPDELRALGGALFGDKRYGRVFIYHNGASSYYAARGFRGSFVA